jgi:NAD(P)-dependent dehydrogenase (short-subunit alcohol dehydrogenase family)
MKSVVTTGSSRGIGLGLAKEFLKQGCAVVISSRSIDTVNRVVEELGAEFGADRVTGCACDVADCDQVQALWDTAHRAFGSVDIWINNAGISLSKIMLWDLPPDSIAPVVETNLIGLMYGCQVAVKGMLAQGSGQIYNFEGHGSNDMIVPGLSVYGATKRGVRYFTEALAEELKDSPVQVGAIGPGIVITDLVLKDLRNMSPENFEQSRVIINILADTVEDVTPFLVDEVLKNKENGASIQWMTEEKANARFEDPAYLERDLLSAHGL